MAFRFRRAFYRLTPSWLHTGDGEKVLFSLGVLADAFLDRLLQGLNARFPERAEHESALAALGRDRQVIRGVNEPAENYAHRLVQWRYPQGHRVRGNPFGLMRQIRAYLAALGDVRVRTVDRRGNWYMIDYDGEQSHSWGVGDWDWDDGGTDRWGRFWVIIYPGTVWTEQLTLGSSQLWGGSLGEDGHVLGVRHVTPVDVATIKLICQQWKPAGTLQQWVIVAFDDASFDPGVTGETDGTWENWSINDAGEQVGARLDTARYWVAR